MRNGVARIFKKSIDYLFGIVASGAGVPESEVSESVGMNMFRRAFEFSEWRDCAAAIGREWMINIKEERLIALDD